jgi:hypothetical protein
VVGAWLVVRAVVADPADRAALDEWYHHEHLRDAAKTFAVHDAWRGWSATDPSIHSAYYGFESRERLDTIMAGPGIIGLIAEFDRRWSGRVTRTRDILVVAGDVR